MGALTIPKITLEQAQGRALAREAAAGTASARTLLSYVRTLRSGLQTIAEHTTDKNTADFAQQLAANAAMTIQMSEAHLDLMERLRGDAKAPTHAAPAKPASVDDLPATAGEGEAW